MSADNGRWRVNSSISLSSVFSWCSPCCWRCGCSRHSHAAGLHAQGPFRRPAATGRKRLCRSADVVCAPGHAGRSRPVAAALRQRRERSAIRGSGVPPFAVFFVHPTSYLGRDRWNASLDDAGCAGAGAAVRPGPREPVRPGERDLGAALSPGGRRRVPDQLARREKALDLAYRDVSQAFDEFLAQVARARRSCSPGTARARCSSTSCCASASPERRCRSASRWPIRSAGRSRSSTISPRSACPPARGPDQAGCIVSWSSFAEPADPAHAARTLSSIRRASTARRARDNADAVRQSADRHAGRQRARFGQSRHAGPERRSYRRRAGARRRPGELRARGLPADRQPAGPRALTSCRATITTCTTSRCSGRTCGRTPRGGCGHGRRRILITTSVAHFRQALPDGGRLLGLDVGTKTIGTALCDAGWRFTTPGKTLPPRQMSAPISRRCGR